MSLKATVQNLRNRAEDARLSETERNGLIEAWRRDVGDVYETIRSALLQVIDEEVVTFGFDTMTISEEELGEYDIDRMTMTIVDRPIYVEPIARMTIRGTGRIDLYRHDRPSESNRIFIVRGVAEVDHAPGVWLIESRRMKAPERLAIQSIVRGYRTYVDFRADNIQDAVDFILKLD